MLTREKPDRSDFSWMRKCNRPHVVDAIAAQFSLIDGVLHRACKAGESPSPVVGFRRKAYLYTKVAGEAIAVHSVVAILSTGALIPDGMVCDHIDGNPFNNHASNIRVVTPQVNVQNSRRNLSVSAVAANIIKTQYGTYSVSYGVSGQRVYLGTFKTIEAAIAARNESFSAYAPEKLAAIQRRGEGK